MAIQLLLEDLVELLFIFWWFEGFVLAFVRHHHAFLDDLVEWKFFLGWLIRTETRAGPLWAFAKSASWSFLILSSIISLFFDIFRRFVNIFSFFRRSESAIVSVFSTAEWISDASSILVLESGCLSFTTSIDSFTETYFILEGRCRNRIFLAFYKIWHFIILLKSRSFFSHFWFIHFK